VPLSRNLENLTSWNPLGRARPVMGLLYLYSIKNYDIDHCYKNLDVQLLAINR